MIDILLIIAFLPAQNVSKKRRIMQRSTTAVQRIGGAYGKYEHVYINVF